MEQFLLVFRGPPAGATDAAPHDAARWNAWFTGLGSAVVERGKLCLGSVEIKTRLTGPKISADTLHGYSVITAADFNEAVKLSIACPVFDEHGWLEIAHIDSPAGENEAH
jgi:hypothetical protein